MIARSRRGDSFQLRSMENMFFRRNSAVSEFRGEPNFHLCSFIFPKNCF